MKPIRTIELLAPARDYASGQAAVDYGADALYIGGTRFGARYAASNTTEEVARLVEYAHAYGVRIHATLNTLIYPGELDEAARTAQELCEAGVDALIVQDMAFRRMNLPVELHASTQVCNTTPEGVRFLEACGFSRVILERGLTLDEIKAIRQATHVPLECFVHGAICVGYSGRCYLSRSQSTRSGNRGECTQACRLPYDLVDASGRTLLQGKHLLSVGDLNLSDRLEDLIDAGIDSFKIEGRLKDIVYVKNTVAYYRRLLDQIIESRRGLIRSSVGKSTPDFIPDPIRSFTRGFTRYYFDGRRPATQERPYRVASFDTPKATGARLGRVKSVGKNFFSLTDPADIVPGDGICFLTGGELGGTNINRIEGNRIYPNRMEGIVPGVTLFRNYDHRFASTVERSSIRRKIAVQARYEWNGQQLSLHLCDETGIEVEERLAGPFDPAQNPEKMRILFQTQTAKSGETIFAIQKVDLPGNNPPFLPSSTVNELRRHALERLLQARLSAHILPQPLPEQTDYPFPATHLGPEYNVTNPLAEQFYRDHGVCQIEQGQDLRPTTRGCRVMTSSYCIRRETGQCLRKKNDWKGTLYLTHGTKRYRLEFDCLHCQMHLFDESSENSSTPSAGQSVSPKLHR